MAQPPTHVIVQAGVGGAGGRDLRGVLDRLGANGGRDW
jgi:hypothetical protein